MLTAIPQTTGIKQKGTIVNPQDQHHYTTSFVVDQTPQEAFNAITNVRGWWSQAIEGHTDQPGAEFQFSQPGIHYSVQKITEMVPKRKVIWHIVDSRIYFVRDKNEWTGTDVVFEITRKGAQTEIRFMHIGLVPTLACYEDCSNAWDFHINDSLRSLITTGKGNPAEKERELLARLEMRAR